MIYEFQATQSFNGYDKPWPAGGGKNLLSITIDKLKELNTSGAWNGEVYTYNGITYTFTVSDGYVTQIIANGTATGGRSNLGLCDITIPAGSYVISGCPSGGSTSSYWLGSSAGNFGDDVGSGSSFTKLESLTFGSGDGPRIANEYTANNVVFKPMLCLSTATNPDYAHYAPYSNICMPEGFNIWNPYNDEFIQIYAGYVNSNTRELYLRPVYEEYDGEELVGPWMSSMDAYSEESTPTTGAFVIDFGGELTSFEITPFMLQTLLDSLGIRQHFTDGAGLLNSLMDQAQGRVRSEEELLHLSRPLNVIAIGDQLPAGLHIRPISKDVLPGLPGKFIR